MCIKKIFGGALILFNVMIFAAEQKETIPAGDLTEYQGRLQRTVSIYLAELLNQPNNADLWFKVAKIEYELKNWPLAINALQHALEIQPQNSEIHKFLSQIYAELNQPKKALAEINEAVKYNPSNYEYLMTQGLLENWNKNPEQALESYQRALYLIKDKKPDLQLRLLREIASLQNQLHNPQAAITMLQQAIALAPQNAALYRELAQSYAGANNPQQALESINSALKIEPNNIQFLEVKAMYASWLKDFALAKEIYQNILKSDPKNIGLWLKVAKIEYELKNWSLAIEALQHALEIQPQNSEIHKFLSQIYAELNQPKKALAEINEAVKYNPSNYEYLMTQGLLENWNKNPEQALESYQRALYLIRGKNTDLQLRLLREIASLQNQLHNPQAAITMLQQAVALAPQNAALYRELAQSYAGANNPQQALESINSALKIEPNNIQFLEVKAMYASWLKDYALAKEVYQNILKLDPRNKVAINGIANINNTVYLPPINIVKPKSRYDSLIDLANNYAVKRQYSAAAQVIKQAIQLKPRNAALYKQLATIYATAKDAKNAYLAITEAVRYAPFNISYWRDRAKIAAWAEEKAATQESYEQILKLKPNDEDAMLQLAHTLAWRGFTDEAIENYRALLSLYPQNKEGWLQYAEVSSWVEGYPISFDALAHYQRLGGEPKKYLEVKARLLALSGYYESSLAINDLLLTTNPNSTYLLSTEVTALLKGLQVNRAVATLDKALQIAPTDPALQGLKNIVLTPLRSNINLGFNYTGATDTTNIYHIPTLNVQYFLKPSTSIQLQGIYEYATADKDSGLNPINGGTSIGDESLMVGLSHQFASLFNLTGLVGGLNVDGEDQHLIYDILFNTNLDERTVLTVESLRNLYRPYLVPQSPRLISLQIMENRIGMTLQWQPYIQKYLNIVLSHSDLSDYNGYWHYNIWPKMRVYSSQYWQVNLGINADDWRYKRRTNSGYFSPLHFQGYEGTIELYHGFTENIGMSLSGGFGMQKDETFPRFFYEEDLAAQLFLGIFTDWQLKISGAYTLRENPIGAYQSWYSGLIITRRL
ncbi:protein with TPR motifs (protein-protein interaction motif) [Legionella beliardensis]|uniref:Protein with TPR motifs (Protein-protein interaction motif) n=1 Tax=Legionella beliardensis TaxID=91822 RepID=A0A378I3J1_9GAMM|nr:tetratricopeptide repeat protein [Legionella beliardensis]STX29747.1 protein with TPR motifs (protein-protein interaction motif) [Legionella beliardensis]